MALAVAVVNLEWFAVIPEIKQVVLDAFDGARVGGGIKAENGAELYVSGCYFESNIGNNAGGVLGGISSGQDILVSIALKPTSSLRLPGRSVNLEGDPVEVVTTGRHDPCVGIRATPIAEAMLAIVLMDHYLRHRAQNADVESATPVILSGAD